MKLASRYPCAKWISSRSKPASSDISAARRNWPVTRSMSSRVISRGTGLCSNQGTGDAAMIGHPSASSGSLSPSQDSRVDAFRPACPSCMPIAAAEWRCTKSTIRFHAPTCAGSYMPVQPSEMRLSRLTSVISDITSPAPPIARLPRFTRCQSSGVPSSAEY